MQIVYTTFYADYVHHILCKPLFHSDIQHTLWDLTLINNMGCFEVNLIQLDLNRDIPNT